MPNMSKKACITALRRAFMSFFPKYMENRAPAPRESPKKIEVKKVMRL